VGVPQDSKYQRVSLGVGDRPPLLYRAVTNLEQWCTNFKKLINEALQKHTPLLFYFMKDLFIAAEGLLSIVYCLLAIGYWLLSVVYCLLSVVYCRRLAVFSFQ
jgi:hypothetical protein